MRKIYTSLEELTVWKGRDKPEVQGTTTRESSTNHNGRELRSGGMSENGSDNSACGGERGGAGKCLRKKVIAQVRT